MTTALEIVAYVSLGVGALVLGVYFFSGRD